MDINSLVRRKAGQFSALSGHPRQPGTRERTSIGKGTLMLQQAGEVAALCCSEVLGNKESTIKVMLSL